MGDLLNALLLLALLGGAVYYILNHSEETKRKQDLNQTENNTENYDH
jgi:hypothetical protein